MRNLYLTLLCGTALTLGACNDSSTPESSKTTETTNTPPTVVDRTTTVDRTLPNNTTVTDTTVTTARSPDNSAINKRDREGTNLTPMDQSNASDDIKLTANIRKALMDDSTLSMNAKNIKVITTKGGVVTLRGPVNSDDERTKIEGKVRDIAGVASVTNELEVKAAETK